MKRILVGGLAIIGGLAILVVVVGLSVGVVYWISKGRVPAKTILEADFERGLIEYVPDDPVAQVMLAKTPIVRHRVEALKRASEDDRVVALVARVGVAEMGLAQIQEVRDAILAFRSKGKPAIRLRRNLRRGWAGKRRVLLSHRLRRHLPASFGRREPDRPDLRAPLHPGDPRKAWHHPAHGPPARVQELHEPLY